MFQNEDEYSFESSTNSRINPHKNRWKQLMPKDQESHFSSFERTITENEKNSLFDYNSKRQSKAYSTSLSNQKPKSFIKFSPQQLISNKSPFLKNQNQQINRSQSKQQNKTQSKKRFEDYIAERKKKMVKKPIINFEELLKQFQSFKLQVKNKLKQHEIIIKYMIRQIQERVQIEIQNWKRNQEQKYQSLPVYSNLHLQKVQTEKFEIIKNQRLPQRNIQSVTTILFEHKQQKSNKKSTKQVSDTQYKLRNMSPDSRGKFTNLFEALNKVKNGMKEIEITIPEKQKQIKGRRYSEFERNRQKNN